MQSEQAKPARGRHHILVNTSFDLDDCPVFSMRLDGLESFIDGLVVSLAMFAHSDLHWLPCGRWQNADTVVVFLRLASFAAVRTGGSS